MATGSTIDLGRLIGATTFSRDGDFVYVTVENEEHPRGALFAVPVLGGDARRVLTDLLGAVGFSPDGTRLAFVRGDAATRESSIIAADLSGGNQKRLATGSLDTTWFSESGVTWSPDGQRLAVMQHTVLGGYRMRPVLIDTGTGAVEPLGAKETLAALNHPNIAGVWRGGFSA